MKQESFLIDIIYATLTGFVLGFVAFIAGIILGLEATLTLIVAIIVSVGGLCGSFYLLKWIKGKPTQRDAPEELPDL